MSHLLINPKDRIQLAELGVSTLRDFCLLNDLNFPVLRVDNLDSTLKKVLKHHGGCGLWTHRGIYIHIDSCARSHPVYSWPAYLSDRTPYGVVAHELGHEVEYQRNINVDSIAWKSTEDAITGYCPNNSEWFAEMFRVFVTNPDLLKLVRPMTYLQFRKIGLKPLSQGSYQDVLSRFSAPPRIFSRLSKKIP